MLLCTGAETPDCLTAGQLKAARDVYRGIPAADGSQRWNGPVVGSEAEWIPAFADNGGYGAFIEHFVYSRNTPDFDWRRELNFSGVYDEAKSKLTPFTAAPSPDITAFVSRGGKALWRDGGRRAVGLGSEAGPACAVAECEAERQHGPAHLRGDRKADDRADGERYDPAYEHRACG